MSDWLGYLAAVALLLVAPGPTNALLAAGGVQRGFLSGLVLLVGVVAGYAVSVALWLLLVRQAAGLNPAIPLAAKLVAVGFLAWSAWIMWRSAGKGAAVTAISTRQVFLTTLLNPKALVIAFALVPAAAPVGQAGYVALVCALAAGIGLGWLALGSLVARSAAHFFNRRRVERGTAAVLALFAGALAIQTLG